jgi:parallel beta-helix repeat protein
MTRTRSAGVLVAVAAMWLNAGNASAKTLVVSNSGINCAPEIVITQLYTTIQAAINAMPVANNAANKVVVCPGIYPEQVKITKNITVTGVLRDGADPASILGNAGEVRIVPPPGGLTINIVAPSGNVAAQVAVQNVADVNLTNLSIDSTNLTGPGGTDIGLGCPRNDDSTLAKTAGIALYNVGVIGTGTRGTVSQSNVHNALGYCPDPGNPGGAWIRSYTGEGILVENSWFTLSTNALSNVDLNLVHQTSGIGIITGNFLNFAWHGIWLTNVVSAFNNVGTTISSNDFTAVVEGVYLDASQNVLVSKNTMLSWTGDGVYVSPGSLNNDILSNTIVDAWHGIYLFGAGGTVVSGNIIVRPTTVAIVDNASHGGNTITGNTIRLAPTGIFAINPADDVTIPNTYYTTTVLSTTAPLGTPVP